jgi:hypothetical protein
VSVARSYGANGYIPTAPTRVARAGSGAGVGPPRIADQQIRLGTPRGRRLFTHNLQRVAQGSDRNLDQSSKGPIQLEHEVNRAGN